LLTGLIIGVILRPQEPTSVVVAVSVIAIVSKHVLRTRWSNIFNPAALALVASSFLFSTGQSWWGSMPDFGPEGIIVMCVVGLFIADRINKLPLVVVFLGAYFALFTVASFLGKPVDVAEVFRTPDLQATLFFAFFMVDDPPTCPARYEDQIPFGLIVAVASFAIFIVVGAVYFLPAGLLVANAWESGRRQFAGPLRALLA
jgi:Na+-translocating ferredoxin:NAD+ oxidoreductase RnfD subunit